MVKKKSIFLFLFLFLLLSFRNSAQVIITGPQFRNATLNSIDVISSHLTLQQAQSMYNKVLNNFSITFNNAPANFYFNDGTVERGSLVRVLTNANFGYGKLNKIAIYGGVQFDRVSEKLNKNVFESVGTTNYISQGLGYIGIAFLNTQIDIGVSGTNRFYLDGNYDFTKLQYQVPWDNSKFSLGGQIISTLYHKSGIFASAIFSEEEYNPMIGRDTKKHLSEIRTNIQPLKKYLPDVCGLPFLGLAEHTPSTSIPEDITDYYYTDLNETADTNKNGALKKYYETNPGSDNLFKKGIRASTTFQIYPQVGFKKAELAYNYLKNKDHIIYGVRTQLFNIDNKLIVGCDAYIVFSGLNKNINLSLSYSYNTPQNVTFLALSKLHVFGVQLTLGKRETAKPIIPFLAAVLSKEQQRVHINELDNRFDYDEEEYKEKDDIDYNEEYK